MGKEHQKIRSIVEVVIDNFLIASGRGANDVSVVENYVVAALGRSFGFTRESARKFSMPCYWYLCTNDGSIYDLLTYPEPGPGDLPVSQNYDLKMMVDGVGSGGLVDGNCGCYSDTLGARLKVADYKKY